MQVHERQVWPPPRLHVLIAVQSHQQEISLLPRTLSTGTCLFRSKFASVITSLEALEQRCFRLVPVVQASGK